MDTVLLITGAGEAATARLRTLPALCTRHRVLTLHVGGDPAQLADEAVTILETAGVESAHVYGVSFGGLVAQHVAARRPDRVRRLVLAATPAGAEPDAATRAFLERSVHMPRDRARVGVGPLCLRARDATGRGRSHRPGRR